MLEVGCVVKVIFAQLPLATKWALLEDKILEEARTTYSARGQSEINSIANGASRNAIGPPYTRFSKMISLNAKNLEETYFLPNPMLHVAVMFSCRTLTRSAKVCCRTLSKSPNLAEAWNVGYVRICPELGEREQSEQCP